MDLGAFFVAIGTDWVALMSGIASVIITIVGIARKWEKIPRWTFWVAALVCFFLAAARVWTTEHRGKLDCEKTLTELTVPRLALTIDQIAIGTIGGDIQELNGRASVLVIASVVNWGANSIAENYHLTALLPDGTKYSNIVPFKTQTPQNLRFFPGRGAEQKAMAVYSQSDNLLDKTFEKPIEKGSRVRGIAVFALPKGVEAASIKVAGTKFILSCSDITGKIAETSVDWRGNSNPPLYYPGLTYPTEQTPTN